MEINSIIGDPVFEAMRLLVLAALAFGIALALTPLVSFILARLGVKKQIRTSEEAPIFSKLHNKKGGTPTMGGVIIWGTVVILVLILAILDWFFDGWFAYFNFLNRAETYLPLAAMVIAALFGLFDDVLGVMGIGVKSGGLRVWHKIILYLLVALIGAWWFYDRLNWDVLSVPFWGNIEIGIWYIPLFILIIIASAFSANETDGLDGLLAGVSLFAFASLAVIAFALGRYDLAAFSAVTVGAILAFLWFNIYPAKFFMGDTGSMALGITIGVISMLTNTVLLLPFLVIIFVIESLSVIIQVGSKKLRGKKIFLSAPIHHHFEALGWHETTVTMRFWIVAVVFNALGLILFFLSRLFL